jgi:hypothetical protein
MLQTSGCWRCSPGRSRLPGSGVSAGNGCRSFLALAIPPQGCSFLRVRECPRGRRSNRRMVAVGNRLICDWRGDLRTRVTDLYAQRADACRLRRPHFRSGSASCRLFAGCGYCSALP